jgi:hypothetical protein
MPPHEIQIDLGEVYQLDGFRYLTRQDGLQYGRVANYQLFVSMDGINWGTAVAAGTFPNSMAAQEVRFPAKAGRHVRFRALSEVSGSAWTVVAELDFLGTATGDPGSSSGGSGSGGSGSSGSGSGGGLSTRRAVFTPSGDHGTLVRHYVLDIFPSWADPSVSNSVLSADLGTPPIVNGECSVDITALLQQLSSGNYIATVTAIGDEGNAQSAPSAEFLVP